MKFKITAFAPGHVTLIFSIRDNHVDLSEKGSIGVGFSINKGVKTSIDIQSSTETEFSIKINGEISEASVTRAVLDNFSIFTRKKKITIDHDIEFPISAGFGASGAGALSTAFALNGLVGKVFKNVDCGKIAHIAEVMNKTGLGDVIGQYHGGFEMRVKEGAPGVGTLKKIDISNDLKVILGSWGILGTKKVLMNITDRKRIINNGETILKEINEANDLNLPYLCEKAREFSEKIDLESSELKEVLKLFMKNGFENCGMVMLGNSFFCFSKEEEIPEILSIIDQLKSKPSIFISEVSKSGAKII